MVYNRVTEKAIELWNKETYSLEMIAKELNVSRMGVKKFLNRHGIDTRKRLRSVKCVGCGKEMLRDRGKLRSNNHHYCSMACYYKVVTTPCWNPDRNGIRHSRKIVSGLMDLKQGYIVHHIDGNESNNDVSNLMVFTSSRDHHRYHRLRGDQSGVIPIWRGDTINNTKE